jgi:small ligand-binding sensory domain FIST
VHELGGQPALKRLEDIVAAMEDTERLQASHGLHIGRVIDEHKADFGSGDFLIRAVLGADRDSGVVAIGDAAPVGSTIQFQVRDARTATDELDLQTSRIAVGDGALLFTCNGRGTNLFESPNHDASRLAERVIGEVLAGMFCAGEIGPVSTQTFLHGFTASAAIFHD